MVIPCSCAELAHYGLKDLTVEPSWSIADKNGKLIAQGRLPAASIPSGRVTSLGENKTMFTQVAAPARLVVTVSAAGTSNSWNIWAYPASQLPAPAGVMIAHEFDQATRDALAAGKSVLLFSSPKEGVIYPKSMVYGPEPCRALPVAQPGQNAIPGHFMPTFWNLLLFNQSTLGILCNPQHPALAEFPKENHSDWQWADLLGHFSCADSFRAAGASCPFWHRVMILLSLTEIRPR